MGRILNDPGEDPWKIRFLTDGRSHKATDMRRASEVTILFQHDPDLAFVSLIGKADAARGRVRDAQPLEAGL